MKPADLLAAFVETIKVVATVPQVVGTQVTETVEELAAGEAGEELSNRESDEADSTAETMEEDQLLKTME